MKGNPLRHRTAMVAALFVAAVAGAAAPSTSARTYDLRIRAYCKPAGFEPDPNKKHCGFASENDFRSHLLANFERLNRTWKPLGVSFRPAGGDLVNFVSIIYDLKYSSVTGGDGLGDCGTGADNIKITELRQIAAVDPDVVTLFILQNLGLCFSAVAPGETCPNALERFGIFCKPWSGGGIWAHEIGHHFCLAHTFSFQDPATDNPVSHDGDGLTDTPDDPGVRECPGLGDDFLDQACKVPEEGHDWCDFTVTGSAIAPATDKGSYLPSYCTVSCFEENDSQKQPIAFNPQARLTMSYYTEDCSGPYVLKGAAVEGFTPQEVSVVLGCIAGVPERASLPDVCLGLGGDKDSDGICQAQDNCPQTLNSTQTDTDHDGTGDACDLCPTVSAPALVDTDHDGTGNLCDFDDDNDGCPDGIDQHPLQSKVPIGLRVATCDGVQRFETIFGSESADSDNDGIANCAETDDDADGTPDAADLCPTSAQNICLFPGICPPPYANVCFGAGCDPFVLKIFHPGDPDPIARRVIDHFQIFNDVLYLTPEPATTVSEMAASLLTSSRPRELGDTASGEESVGGTAVDAASGDGDATVEILRMEIWTRATNEQVSTVGEFSAGHLCAGDFNDGGTLALLPLPPGGMIAGASWGDGIPRAFLRDGNGDGFPDVLDNCVLPRRVGLALLDQLRPAALVGPPDEDSDSVPGPFDNCLRAYNPFQQDSDADGYGNACDPDFDNDGIVTEADVEAVRICLGADLALSSPPSEPGAEQTGPGPDALSLKVRCGEEDMTGDGRVTDADVAAARSALGRPPGPSGRVPRAN